MEKQTKEINGRLKRQRELRGWSQAALAREIGTVRQMVCRWEKGETPGKHFQAELCTLFQLTAEELGFLEPIHNTKSYDNVPSLITKSDNRETISLLATAISQSIIMAVKDLEGCDMNTTRRTLLQLLGNSLVLARLGDNVKPWLNMMLAGDQLGLLESEAATRWAIYHSGNTLQAIDGLPLWIQEIERFAKESTGRQQKIQTYTLVSLSYQLQGSLLRDQMHYPQAHDSYKKAYLAADEFDNQELKSSALARRGVTSIQQQKPIDAIQYLESALTLIHDFDYPCLKGYIFQALSEAQAMAQQKSQSWQAINLAEQVLAHKNNVVELSNCSLNTTSITAQKGVNSVLLKEYARALDLLDRGIEQYDPTLLRGRARLIAQKAEAYCGLGNIEKGVEVAKDAFKISGEIGSQKTINRVKTLHALLEKSYRKDQSVIQLGMMLAN